MSKAGNFRYRAVLSGNLTVAVLASMALATISFHVSYAAAQKALTRAQAKFAGALPITELNEDEAVLHALNRLGYGPRPGDLERVRQIGLERWIDQQLNPSSGDEPLVAERLKPYPTISMASNKLLEEYPPVQAVAKQEGVTKQEVRQEQIQTRNLLRSANAQAPSTGSSMPGQMESGDKPNVSREVSGPNGTSSGQGQDPAMQPPIAATPPSPPIRRIQDIAGPQRIVAELSGGKLIRAIYSDHQLAEVMDDFWFNHFNVFAGKGADRWLLTSYERDTIRPHVLGKFQDLVLATAKSPAMLFYLDNWQSVDPAAVDRMQQEIGERRAMFQQGLNRRFPLLLGPFPPMPASTPSTAPNQKPQAKRGLNENYARELMELHTLGVDGGYTQQDVTEVARAFTGWTMRAPRRAPEFYFAERLHDNTPKLVLGKKIDSGGMRDGEAVLDLLAHQPNTAKFISRELAQRFVSDQPPAALVDRMANTFLKTDGDIRAVLRTMIYSPEFWSRESYRAKVKTPFELVVSAARAAALDVRSPLPLIQATQRIGEPLYQCQPPTGYSDKAESWVNTGALLNRMNFALALTGNRLLEDRTDLASLLGPEARNDPQQALKKSIDLFLGGQVSEQTRETLEKKLNDPQVLRATLDDPLRQVDLGLVAGLVLGSPEFQRR